MKLPAVFFDIGNTLATPRLSPPPVRLEGLDVFPAARNVLRRLHEGRRVRIGIISNTGGETAASMKEVLEQAGIFAFFDPALLLYSSVVGREKNSPALFALAAKRAGFAKNPARCLFVGEDPAERTFAARAGLRVADSPAAALILVNRKPPGGL